MEKTVIYPPKLRQGSHIRVIAPARSLSLIGDADVASSLQRLQAEGFRISFGKHVKEMDEFLSSSIDSRIADLHEAFADPDVDGILTVIGGFNCNQLANYLDYELIRNNPKFLCGFSDITALSLAIFSQTGLVTYSGPHFSSWAMQKGFEYSREAFLASAIQSGAISVQPAKEWSDDPWYMDQENRVFLPHEGYWNLNGVDGELKGRLMGGHMRCLNAYQGTRYWPGFSSPTVLFIEEDAEINVLLFDRQLQSLLHMPDFKHVTGIVIGRFQKDSKIQRSTLEKIIGRKRELAGIPVIANADFGHTTPIFTYPLGGHVSVSVRGDDVQISFDNH